MTITKQAAAAAEALRAEAPRARTRTLGAGSIEDAIREHLKHARRARRTHPEAVVVTTLCGGHVANGYSYTAHTDHVRIEGGRAAELDITAERKHAQSRARGLGATMHIRRRSPEQSLGTILVSR